MVFYYEKAPEIRFAQDSLLVLKSNGGDSLEQKLHVHSPCKEFILTPWSLRYKPLSTNRCIDIMQISTTTNMYTAEFHIFSTNLEYVLQEEE